jgi:DNA repair protein RadA/Sms
MRFSSSYVCQQCGYISPVSLGRCPNCDNWNSFVETVEQVGKDSGGKKRVVSKVSPVKLSLVEFKSTSRVTTGNGEIDLVLGGGVVPGMAVLLAGEPGIGKSTLLLSIADSLSNKLPGEILYIC